MPTRTKPQNVIREETEQLYKEVQPYADCSNIYSVLSVLTRQCQLLIHILFNQENSREESENQRG